ncbi:PepSY-associated TM helix domain-containing protein [Azospirillum brasilense]|uniref:PepSY-associated TM helix domain-containing protein n=1 Tax=Azospirillum brasilense TaxID=192 RepID=UPI001FFF7EBE|nr:PepSY-associated TM helix domain-containing protein [Azospirillum brasilense]
MNGSFRLSMTWLHNWGGLVVGWLLFCVFLTGTTAYARFEITRWMQPERIAATNSPAAAAAAIASLSREAPQARRWLITMPDERRTATQVYVYNPPGIQPAFRKLALEPADGRPVQARATFGGDFLYYFHFDLRVPGLVGRYLIGAAGVALLVALITGFVIHRRVFWDFFTFRPNRSRTRLWMDVHNALGIIVLPYHALITVTGLVPLMLLYMPWGLQAAFGDRPATFNTAVYAEPPPVAVAGRPAPLTAIEPLLAEAARRWDGGRPGWIIIDNPGDAAATILLKRTDSDRVVISPQAILFDGTTGAVREVWEGTGGAAATRAGAYGLHMMRFADTPLRLAMILCGLAGTAMIGTGQVYWIIKRRKREATPSFGLRLADGANLAVMVGLPIAIAAYFWANRLLPAGLAGRETFEALTFFAAWFLTALHPALRGVQRAWGEQLAAAALLWTALPVLNALTSEAHLGVTLARGLWGVAGIDLTALATGALFGLLAWRRVRAGGWRNAAARGPLQDAAARVK